MRANVGTMPSQPNSADVHAVGLGVDGVLEELELLACAILLVDAWLVDAGAVGLAAEAGPVGTAVVELAAGVTWTGGSADAGAPRPLSVASIRFSCCWCSVKVAEACCANVSSALHLVIVVAR